MDKKTFTCSTSQELKHRAGTQLLLGQESIGVCVPVQQVVVVKSEAEPSAISFMGALRIPGVVEFSLCLLFAKLVSYTFLFWLPLYITKAGMLLVCGGLVNGPYALITTAVSADLGTQESEGQCQGSVYSYSYYRWHWICWCCSGTFVGRVAVLTRLGSGLLHAHDCRLFSTAAFTETCDEGALLS